MTNDALVDISFPETWPRSLTSAVQEADRRTAFATHACDLNIAPGDADVVWEALRNSCVHARHFTRLLPHELQSIRVAGLRLHSLEHFDQRIDEATAHGYIDARTASELKSVSIPAAAHGQRGVRDFVWLTIGPVAEQDPAAVAQLMSNWGGEGIYFSVGSKPYKQLLQSLGRPSAIHVALPLNHRAVLRFHPPLENLLLGRVRGLRDLFGDVSSQETIRPTAIVDIELLDDPGGPAAASG